MFFLLDLTLYSKINTCITDNDVTYIMCIYTGGRHDLTLSMSLRNYDYFLQNKHIIILCCSMVSQL